MPRLIITSTDIQRSEAVVFDNNRTDIEDNHVIACVGFPFYGIGWTKTDDKTGYEIQIDDLALPDGRAEHKTGAIYDILPPATLASKQVEEWNTFEIHALGQNYTVILNEITVIPKFSGNRLIRGYIGIQNHDAESK
jgi:hypothetical protein